MSATAYAGCLSVLLLGGGAGKPLVHSVAAGPGPLARVVPILDEAWSGSSVNVVADQHHTLFSDGRVQYAAFYAADGRLVLARRILSEDRWETATTPSAGNVADAHNTASIVVDGEGYLHVAWDHHASPLKYARGIAPGSLELGPKASMTGRREDSVTYPSFFRLPGGDLLFLYRDGRSGRGNVVLNRYHTKARTWRQVHANLVDGEGTRSAYLAATLDARALHLAWNWRDTPDVATNHDLCYARSADGGATWTTSGGAPLALPITAATAEYATRIPRNRDLMNPPSITVDADGRPYVATYWSPPGSNVPQFHLVRHDGAQWQVTPMGRRTTPFSLQGTGTRRPPISRGVVLTRRRGKAQAVYLVHRDDERGGRVTLLSCEDIRAPRWKVHELTAGGLGAWEPSIDPVRWHTSGEIHLLVQAVSQRDGDDRQPVVAPPTPIGLLVWKP